MTELTEIIFSLLFVAPDVYAVAGLDPVTGTMLVLSAGSAVAQHNAQEDAMEARKRAARKRRRRRERRREMLERQENREERRETNQESDMEARRRAIAGRPLLASSFLDEEEEDEDENLGSGE